MSTNQDYVRTDENGVMRIGGTRVMFDSVIAGFVHGDSPETIQQQYPSLSLEEVYGAVAYYLANQTEVDDYLRRQNDVWKEWRQKAEVQPCAALQRLRATKRTETADSSS